MRWYRVDKSPQPTKQIYGKWSSVCKFKKLQKDPWVFDIMVYNKSLASR